MDRFANILLSGPCNLRCPHCIGHALRGRRLPENLDLFPLRGLDEFVARLNAEGIREVSLTGTDTDPQLYRYEVELLACLRSGVPGVRVSLHTNGRLVLRKMDVFNRYDRATISIPSFTPAAYRRMTGRPGVPDLQQILRRSVIPVKISTLVTIENRPEIPALMTKCRELGIQRLVLRKLYGETRPDDFFPGVEPRRYFAGNPVYDCGGLEVTVWDFTRSTMRCLNLWSDGTISRRYELAR